jgi:hypothetical protein
VTPKIPKRKTWGLPLSLLLLLGPLTAQAAPLSGAFPDFSSTFKVLPPYIQAELLRIPDNSVDIPLFKFPTPPKLNVDVMLGANWRLNDGYGFWLGDGESPLATAADYSAYDKAQVALYLQNRKYFAGFNTRLAAETARYAEQYAKAVQVITKENQAYQNLLLTYPEAVTKNYVLMYLENRNLQLDLLTRHWMISVAHIRGELSGILGQDLGALTNYDAEGGMDGYVRKMNLNLVNSERTAINDSWAPMTQDALKPLQDFQPKELTIAEAEKMQWGLPPKIKIPKTKIALPAPGASEQESLSKAYNTLVNTPATTAAETPTSWIEQILALLLLVGGGGWWLSRKRGNKRKAEGEPEN